MNIMDHGKIAQFNILFQIALDGVKKGTTTWILKSLVRNPACIVVAYDAKAADYLRYKYNERLRNSPWWLRLKWHIFGRVSPRFESMGNFRLFKGQKLPVIFDNSCFLN